MAAQLDSLGKGVKADEFAVSPTTETTKAEVEETDEESPVLVEKEEAEILEEEAREIERGRKAVAGDGGAL